MLHTLESTVGILSIGGATGFHYRYPWLHVPVVDVQGDIEQYRGITPAPGLYVIGLRFMHRRNSQFIDRARPTRRRSSSTLSARTTSPAADPGALAEGGVIRHHDYDVIVVGARCAGSATAMLLARQGLRVLVLDRMRYGSDTVSTHALMRGGVLQLSAGAWSTESAAAGTPPVTRVLFHYPDDTVRISLKPAAGVHSLFAPRRTVLDRSSPTRPWKRVPTSGSRPQ